MSKWTKYTPTGYCLGCGAPVPDGVLYCDPSCGKAFREGRPTHEKRRHVCTPECTARWGFCIVKRNEKRRARWQADKRYYQVLL